MKSVRIEKLPNRKVSAAPLSAFEMPVSMLWTRLFLKEVKEPEGGDPKAVPEEGEGTPRNHSNGWEEVSVKVQFLVVPGTW